MLSDPGLSDFLLQPMLPNPCFASLCRCLLAVGLTVLACAGASFLPWDCGSYRQMPYEEVGEAEYRALLARMPPSPIPWSRLREGDREPLGR